MRRSACIGAVACFCLALSGLLAICQTPASASPTPEALNSAYTQAMQARDWARAVSTAQQRVDASPTAENLRLLADTQLSAGAKEESLAAYDRALAAAHAEKPTEDQPLGSWKELMAKIYAGKGNALLSLYDNEKAVEAYTESAKLTVDARQVYFSICAVRWNTGNMHDPSDLQVALAACRRSLQADPTRPDTWFMLGSALYENSPTDSKGNHIISAETRQAFEKYLKLAPRGPHAGDVKTMLHKAAQ